MAIHINNWIKKAEPDYYTMFIKAWIPFNAWYVDKYPVYEANDSQIIQELINESNDIKKFIHSLLSPTDFSFNKFCFHLSELHIELEKCQHIHRGNIICFSSMHFGKYKCSPYNFIDSSGISFQASQPNLIENVFKAQVVEGGKNHLIVKTTTYDIEYLKAHKDYIGLATDEMRKNILICFSEINPDRTESVISNSLDTKDFILLNNNNHSKFKNDNELIAKFLIKILYLLRCKLFHGEINPNETNSTIYEHSFHILKLIINKI